MASSLGKGTVFTVHEALPLMTDGGSIIRNGSAKGIKGTPDFSIYSATKATIRNLERSWGLDLKGTGIRVNVLSPGVTGLLAQTPAGRIGEPNDIAAVAFFLASDDSRVMTGSEVFADGGQAQV